MKIIIKCTLVFLGTVCLVACVATKESMYAALWIGLWLSTEIVDLFPLQKEEKF